MTNQESSTRTIVARPSTESKEIQFLSRAMEALASASTLDEVKEIRDQAELARNYARSATMGLAIQNQAAEIKIRAERKAGQFLAEANLRGGNRRSRSKKQKFCLEDIGVSRKQSERWQLEAAVPEAAFEQYVSACGRHHRELSSAAVLRLGKKVREERSALHGQLITSGMQEVAQQVSRLVAAGRQFSCLYAHPEWPAQRALGASLAVKSSSESTRAIVRELKALEIRKLVASRAHLHLRCSCHTLSQGLSVMGHWGFKHVGALCLVHRQGGFGPFWRSSCDLVLLGVRGDLPFRDSSIEGYLDGGPCVDRELTEMLSRVSPGPYCSVLTEMTYSGWTNISAPQTADDEI